MGGRNLDKAIEVKYTNEKSGMRIHEIHISREVQNATEPHWLIFNGPASHEWTDVVEKILDEGYLDLTSGEHLILSDQIKVIFETTTVANVRSALGNQM